MDSDTTPGPLQNSQSHELQFQDTAEKREWFLMLNDRYLGPISAREVTRRLACGEINAATSIWREDFPDWVLISSVPQFASGHLPEPHADQNAGQLSGQSQGPLQEKVHFSSDLRTSLEDLAWTADWDELKSLDFVTLPKKSQK